jgi:carbon monoxide dehydrogenase subunit G
MELANSQLIPRRREEVWSALNDPEVLKACIAGCETMDKVSESEYVMAVTAAIGPVKARFKGRLLLADLEPPKSYTLSFDGQGGVAGFGKGTARVSLAEEGEATRLEYTVKAQVGGRIAQVGSRLVDAAAKKMADDFFAAFIARVAPEGAVREAPAAKRLPPAWWWAIAAIVAAALAYWLTR